MADTNAQLEELTRLLGQVNYEMEMFGRVTKRTADEMYDAEMKDKLGINNATKGMAALSDGLTSLAGAAGAAGKAMLDGKKGAGAFNDSIDGMAKAATAASIALALMIPGGPLLKLFFAGVALAATALADYTKKANDMADKLYKGYSGLSKAGAAASDGMTGVYKGAKKLGLSMDELDGYVSLVAANSKDLALFSGSVFEGRKKLEDMGGALEGSREDFLKMGMSMTDMTDGMLGYLKIQTRLGNAQGKTTDELAAGAKKYLIEQDQLTKLTGQTRKEMEDQRERALQGEQFAAKIRELELQGPEGKKAAEELMKMNAIYEAAGPKMAAAFQASVTGNLSNADAQAANLASNGAMLETTQKVIAGQMSYTDAVDITGKAMGKTADTMGVVLGQFGAYNADFGPLHEQLKLAQMAQNGITESMAKIKADQDKLLAGGVDPMLKSQAELISKQIQANEATEDFIKKGIGPAQAAMKKLADLTIAGANKLNELTPGGKAITDNTKGNIAGAVAGGVVGNYAGKKAAGAISEAASKKAAGAVTSKVIGKALGGAIGGIVGSIIPGAGTILGGIGGAIAGDYIGEWMGKTFFGGEDAPVAPEPEARASGGPVAAGKTYKVGEKGEELFTPKVAGEIIPNDKIADIISSITGTSKSMTTGSRELGDAFDEIVKDSQKLEKLTDTDTKRAEKYSLAYKSYVDLKNQLMDLETPDLKTQIDLLQQKAFQASTGGTSVPNSALVNSTISGASGGGAPGGSNMPSMGGGQGISAPVPPGAGEGATSAGGGDSKPKLGTISSKGGKSTSVAADAAPAFQQLLDYLDSVGYEIKSLGGYVDRDVRGQPGVKSVHAKGGAIDINPAENPMGSALVTDMPEGIKQLASSLGLGWGGAWNSVKDAMHFSAAKNEGGRIMAKEGIQVDGPETGYPATLHGKEAVIPMKNGSGDFVKMFEDMSESNRNLVKELKAGRQQNFELLGLVQDLVRSQKDSTSIQERILQTSM